MRARAQTRQIEGQSRAGPRDSRSGCRQAESRHRIRSRKSLGRKAPLRRAATAAAGGLAEEGNERTNAETNALGFLISFVPRFAAWHFHLSSASVSLSTRALIAKIMGGASLLFTRSPHDLSY